MPQPKSMKVFLITDDTTAFAAENPYVNIKNLCFITSEHDVRGESQALILCARYGTDPSFNRMLSYVIEYAEIKGISIIYLK